jgi:hypothetical protein
MAAENTTGAARISNEQALRFQLAGVEAEKSKTQAYLNQLNAVETDLRQRLMTGTPTATARKTSSNGKTAKAAKTKTAKTARARQITPEQRKAMSEAAKRRWALRRGDQSSEETNTTSAAVQVLQPPAGMSENVIQ